MDEGGTWEERPRPPKRPRKQGVAPADGEWPDPPPGTADGSGAPNPNAKRKVAMLLAYNGVRYSGLQKNPGVETVEGVLEAAAHRAGGITAENFGTLQKISWSRAGRTDKGVHALGQIVSAKLVLSPDGLLSRINDELAGSGIALLGIERVTNSFCAHTLCTSREYEYVLPVSILRPRHSLATESVGNGTAVESKADGDEAAGKAESSASPFSAEERARLAAILGKYEGTHHFHNFTDGKLTSNDKSAQRYMMSIGVGENLELSGVQYVALRFHGQSFLLHQIRKMTALAVATFRGDVTDEAIATALGGPRIAGIPLAPSCALFLRHCLYASYERKRTPDRGSVHFPASNAAQQDFLTANILPHIAQCEAAGEFDRFAEALSSYRMQPEPESEAGTVENA